jgi:hypothetical protein
MNRDKRAPVGMAAAKQAGADFIDLNELIASRYDTEGQKKVTDTYFPEKETTHTDWAGAVLNADCVVSGIKALAQNDLKNYILSTPPIDLKNPSGKPR